jgi:hypothetical protein
MTQYRISNNKRKYSTTPIVEVITDAQGNETEKMVCICLLPKNEGNLLSEKIIKLLNSES